MPDARFFELSQKFAAGRVVRAENREAPRIAAFEPPVDLAARGCLFVEQIHREA